MGFWGPNGPFGSKVKVKKKADLGCTHVAEQLLFSIFSSILIFDFDLILGRLFLFGALMGCFLGWGRVQKLFLGSTHIVKQLHFL